MTEVFVGRGEELSKLESAMRAEAPAVAHAVCGLGGMGKSSLAAAYSRVHGAEHAGIWWLIADSRVAAEAGLADLTRRLCPQGAGHPYPEVLSQWAISWLAQHPGLLLIWDNVEDLEDVRDLVAALPRIVHLLTSRRTSGWHRIGVKAPLVLGPLPAADALELLTALAGSALIGAEASELCKELGYLPLAVEQVGAYLAEAGMTAAQYLAAWRTGLAAPGWAAELSRSDRIMTGVWRATLDRLSDTPMAGQVLRVLAWLAPEGVPVVWLSETFNDDGGVREALRRLNAFSMVTLSSDGTVGVHRVVQAVSRMPDSVDEHRQPAAIISAQRTAAKILESYFPKYGSLSDMMQQWRVLVPHIESFAALISRGNHAQARSAGRMAQFIALLDGIFADVEQMSGSEHADTMAARSNVGHVFRTTGRLAEVIALFDATLADQRESGSEHPDTLAARNVLAGLYEMAGRLEEATGSFESTFASYGQVLGSAYLDKLTALGRLAGSSQFAGRLGDFIAFVDDAAIGEWGLGSKYLDDVAVGTDSADLYETAGRLMETVRLFEALRSDYERGAGPGTLTSIGSLARINNLGGRLGEALASLEANLADYERALGLKHSTTDQGVGSAD